MMADNFTQKELNDAKSLLFHNMYEFYLDTESGHRLRMNAIDAFKNQNSIKTDDFTVLTIEADLANDVDISNALKIEQSIKVTTMLS